MYVLFDARLLHRALSGLERVQRNLLHELRRHPDVKRLRVLVRPGTVLPDLLKGIESTEVHSTEEILAILLGDEPPDVYHLSWFPDSTPRDAWLPLAAPASVVEVHDAILNRHPEYLPDRNSWSWYHDFCKTLVRHADALLCHSQSVAGEIRDDLDGDDSRAVVAPLAVEGTLREPLDDATVRERLTKLGVDPAIPFFAMVGKDYPHKDHATAFRALARMDGEPRIVIAGCKVWHDGKDTEDLLHSLGLTERIQWFQGLDDDDVKAMLQGSRALLYPSLEEGFGLPPIEAMALGVPVIAARSMSIPEVCGEGAWLFDPGDDAAMAEQMAEALGDGPVRADQVERGRQRESDFRWEKTAAGTVECYRRAIANSKDRAGTLDREAVSAALRVTALSRFDDGRLLAAWQERCRSVEHQLEQAAGHVARLEEELRARQIQPPKAPDLTPPPPEPDPNAIPRPRWSLRRRLRKICDSLRGRPS